MSDAPALSKSAKKNKKRRENKHNSSVGKDDGSPSLPTPPVVAPPPDPKALLKKQLEEAKAAKDLKKAQELREQLWLLEDTRTLGQAGPGAPKLDPTLFAPPPLLFAANPPPAKPVEDPVERSLGKLRKKLTQIEELRAKKDRGETLDVNQLAKIEKAEEVEEEIASLEKQLSSRQLR